jgi:hypothetical protein
MNATIRTLAGFALLAAALSAPACAAPAPAETAAGETITFDQYRDWRMHFIEQRQLQLAAELAGKNIGAEQRARLDRQKAYYDYFATMQPAERDRRFRERFDRIDANRDGIIDRGERTAWHEKQRAFYRQPDRYRREAATGDAAHR